MKFTILDKHFGGTYCVASWALGGTAFQALAANNPGEYRHLRKFKHLNNDNGLARRPICNGRDRSTYRLGRHGGFSLSTQLIPCKIPPFALNYERLCQIRNFLFAKTPRWRWDWLTKQRLFCENTP